MSYGVRVRVMGYEVIGYGVRVSIEVGAMLGLGLV